MNHNQDVVWRGDPVGRLKTRFERSWCSSWPPAVRCSTVAPEGTRAGHLVRANSACRRRANCMAVVDILRGNSSQLLVEDCPPELTAECARVHDNRVAHSQRTSTLETASLPLTRGGLGVGCSARVPDAAFWGGWADYLCQTPTSCAGHDDWFSQPEIRVSLFRDRGCESFA